MNTMSCVRRRQFFDPTPEEQNIVLVAKTIVHRAQQLIESCEHCNPDAEIPFDWILDRLTGKAPA
jgi:hypothetical protein